MGEWSKPAVRHNKPLRKDSSSKSGASPQWAQQAAEKKIALQRMEQGRSEAQQAAEEKAAADEALQRVEKTRSDTQHAAEERTALQREQRARSDARQAAT